MVNMECDCTCMLNIPVSYYLLNLDTALRDILWSCTEGPIAIEVRKQSSFIRQGSSTGTWTVCQTKHMGVQLSNESKLDFLGQSKKLGKRHDSNTKTTNTKKIAWKGWLWGVKTACIEKNPRAVRHLCFDCRTLVMKRCQNTYYNPNWDR